MPLIGTRGAGSARGFGGLASSPQFNYIEDVFSTWLYTGNSTTQTIPNSIALASTEAWSGVEIREGSTYTSGGPSTICADSSGNTYSVQTANDGSLYNLITKFNSNLSVVWQRKLRQGSSTSTGISINASGDIVVVGSANDGSSYQLVAKYNTDGILQWQRKLTGSSISIRSCFVDSAGNIYFAGQCVVSATGAWCFGKYNSSGVLQWQRTLYQGDSGARAITVDSSGNVYITGHHTPSGSNVIVTAKYNSSGVLQWQKQATEASGSGVGYAIATDSTSVYVVGYLGSPTGLYLLKYDTNGALQWQRKLYLGITTWGDALTLDSSGNVYVGNSLGLVAKYSSSGTLQWQRRFSIGTSSLFADTSNNLCAHLNEGNFAVSVRIPQGNAATGIINKVQLSVSNATDSTGTATVSNSSGTDAAGSLTDSTGTATDSTGTASFSTFTQSAVISNGGMVWIKDRGFANGHCLYDTNRGNTQRLVTNTTDAQASSTALTGFNSNGFTVDNNGTLSENGNTNPITSWTFRKQPKFFDVVTYTGNGSDNRAILHSLGSVPGMIIVKRTSTGGSDWFVWHRSLGPTYYLKLNTTDGTFIGITSVFGGTAQASPTSTAFYVGTNTVVNGSSETYVAYLFAHDAGGFGLTGTDNVISCGSYTGTGAAGNAITLGYEPQWVLIKRTDSTGSWGMTDTMRGMSATNNLVLYSDLSNAELDAGSPIVFPTATGFTCGTGSAGWNASGGTYIYIAIRRGPMRTPTTGTSVFSPIAQNVAVNTSTSIGFAADAILTRQNRTQGSNTFIVDRLRGYATVAAGTNGKGLPTYYLDIESDGYGNFYNVNNTTALVGNTTASVPSVSWFFRRASGFFDIVCWTGNVATNRALTHSLGVVPELIIAKDRSNSQSGPGRWWTYSNLLAANEFLAVNETSGKTANSNATPWQSAPTRSLFYVGSNDAEISLNRAGNLYVAYLFATCPGVSKVGSYTGNGSSQTINCGFTAGARFVLIKRTDSTGDWYVWDTARGIVSANDPHLSLNSSAAEVTDNDSIDPDSSGFIVNQLAATNINVNTATYIYLAIA